MIIFFLVKYWTVLPLLNINNLGWERASLQATTMFFFLYSKPKHDLYLTLTKVQLYIANTF